MECSEDEFVVFRCCHVFYVEHGRPDNVIAGLTGNDVSAILILERMCKND